MVAVLVERLLSRSVGNSLWIPPDNGGFRHDSFLPRRIAIQHADRTPIQNAMHMPSSDLRISRRS